MAPNCLLNFDDDRKTKRTNLQYAIGKGEKKFLHSNLFDYNCVIFKMRIYFIHKPYQYNAVKTKLVFCVGTCHDETDAM